MKCPGRELLFDPRADADRTAFTAHAATCEECRPLLALHRSAFGALGAQKMIELDQRKLWANIDAGRRAPRRWFDWQVGFAAAAVLASAMFIFVRLNDPDVAVDEWIEVAENSELEFAGAELKVSRGSKILFSSDTQARELRLFRGYAEIELAETNPLTLETPRARILAIGANYQVEVEPEKVRISVKAGQVTAIEGARQHLLKTGETLELRDPPPAAEPEAPSMESAEPAEPRATTVEPAEHQTPRSASKKNDEIEAMMLAADALRRAGELDQAEKRYGRVIAHSAGAAFREEASLRRATILSELGKNDEALRALQNLPANGNLIPERAALEAQIIARIGAEK